MEEWLELDSHFHEVYVAALDTAFLTADAQLALEKVAAGRHTQSLLSMLPHELLMPLIDRFEIGHFFDRIDGHRGGQGSPGDFKTEYLVRHLQELTRGDEPGTVAVIGDTPDDAVAALSVGARVVLYDGGSHHRTDLDEMGVPVTSTLLEAVDLILEASNEVN